MECLPMLTGALSVLSDALVRTDTPGPTVPQPDTAPRTSHSHCYNEQF